MAYPPLTQRYPLEIVAFEPIQEPVFFQENIKEAPPRRQEDCGRDHWQVAMALPSTVVLDRNDYVTLELETDRPYVFYDEHRIKY